MAGGHAQNRCTSSMGKADGNFASATAPTPHEHRLVALHVPLLCELLAHHLVPSGEVKPLSGTPYSVRFTEFYTHWVWDRKPVNMSFEEQNPAVKVEVLQDGKLQYSAWGFKNMPFFRMGHHAPSAGVETQKQLAFTLVNYEGLKLPAGAGGRG